MESENKDAINETTGQNTVNVNIKKKSFDKIFFDKIITKLVIVLLVLLAISTAVNQIRLNNLLKPNINSLLAATGASTSGSAISEKSVIPRGIPKIYGKELSLSYDDIDPYDQQKADAAIKKLADFDINTELNEEELRRYTTIALKISCEHCCGAPSIILQNGKAACGCAHSYAMRGLAKYLIRNHANKYTDDEILEELGKWKTLFFPGQIQAKASILKEKGIELNYINLASNKYRGIEKDSEGNGMVGGC